MSDASASSSETPPPRTTGGGFRWEPPTAEQLQAMMPGYTIEKILGRGGMGAVYKGVQTNLDRTVAIKILPPGVEKEDPSFAERFKNEAKLMAKLMSPTVVGVFDFGLNSGGQLYIAMEYVDGTDVAQMISTQKKLPPDHALAITAHVCDALTAAHELGIVHRDIKPANVLINMKGQVKVADFGLAKIEEPGSHGLTKTGYAMGTPDFVAPEALMLGTAIDGRADVYAVGVMLYQMLTGNIPRGAFKPASVLVPGLDRRYDPIIQKAMQHDREERHQSAAELRRELDVILTVPLVQQEASTGQSAIPAAQVAQMPAQRSAAQKPVGKTPQPKSTTDTPVCRDTAPAGRSAHGTPQPPAKSKTPLLIGLGVAAAIGIGAFVMFGGKKPERLTTTTAPGSAPKTSAVVVPAALISDGGRHPELFPLPMPKRPTVVGKVVVWRLDGKPVDPADPEVKLPSSLDDVVMLAAGSSGMGKDTFHILALHSHGGVSAWGGNGQGQATPPAGLSNIVAVAACDNISAALDAAGHVVAWGESGKINKMTRWSEKTVSLQGNKFQFVMLSETGKLGFFGQDGADAPRWKDHLPAFSGRTLSIGLAGDYFAALRDDGALFAVGSVVGVVDGKDGLHTITEPRLSLPGFPETNRFPLAAGARPQLWTNNSTTDVWVSGFEKSPIRISAKLPDYVKNSSKFLMLRALDLTGLERVDQSEPAAALKFGSSWRFERGFGASNLPYCESQAEGCTQLVFTRTHAFGIKPQSVIAAQQLAAIPATPTAPNDSMPKAVSVPKSASSTPTSQTAPAPSVSKSPPLPVSQSPAFPPGQWVKVFTKLEDLPADQRKPDSGVKFENGRLTTSKKASWRLPAEFVMQNGGIRFTATRDSKFELRVRDHGTHFYALKDNKTLVRALTEGGGMKHFNLASSQGISPSKDETVWEIAAVGNRVLARFDSELIGPSLDESISEGQPAFANLLGTVRDIEVINLDGLPEAEALRLLGVDEKGNDLRALAAKLEQQQMEQAKAADALAAIPELKALHEQFVKLQTERVTAPFAAEVAKLNAGYVGGIDREIASEKKAGHLDGVIALEAEKKLIVDRPSGSNPKANELEARSTMPIPAEDDAQTTEALKKLRGIYRAAYAKIEATRAENLKALTDPLSLRLKQIEAELTKKDRVPDAKTVREYREGLGRADGPPFAANGPAAATMNEAEKSLSAVPGTSSQPKVPKPKDAFNEREAAEWVLSFAGQGEVSVTVLVPGKGEQKIQSLALLPKEKFVVRKLTVVPSQETDRDRITDQDAVRLLGLEDVREIHLSNGRLTGVALRAMAQMPVLEALHFQAAHLTASDLAVLENAPVKSLYLLNFTLKDEPAMRVFSKMKNLRMLSLGSLINSEVIAAMPVLPKLEGMLMNTNLELRDDLLPLLAQKFPALLRIDLWGGKGVQGETLASLKGLKDLRDLGLTDTQVDDAKLAAIADMKQIQTLGLSGTKVTDGCIATLKTLKNLSTLNMFQTQITDAGLLALADLRSLKTLHMRHTGSPPIGPPSTGFTEAGVEAFQKKRPDVKVIR